MVDPAVALRFDVRVDGLSLGSFTRCEGLQAEYDVVEWKEGGQNAYVHRIPGRLKYQLVKLTRPLDASSAAVAAWFSSLQATVQRQTGQITAYGPTHEAVVTWNLTGVYPVRWSGPTLATDGSTIATETLELSHDGFLSDGGLA